MVIVIVIGRKSQVRMCLFHPMLIYHLCQFEYILNIFNIFFEVLLFPT